MTTHLDTESAAPDALLPTADAPGLTVTARIVERRVRLRSVLSCPTFEQFPADTLFFAVLLNGTKQVLTHEALSDRLDAVARYSVDGEDWFRRTDAVEFLPWNVGDIPGGDVVIYIAAGTAPLKVMRANQSCAIVAAEANRQGAVRLLILPTLPSPTTY